MDTISAELILILFLFFILIGCCFGFLYSVYFVFLANPIKLGGSVCTYNASNSSNSIGGVIMNGRRVIVDGNNFIYNLFGQSYSTSAFNSNIFRSIIILLNTFKDNNMIDFVIKNMDINKPNADIEKYKNLQEKSMQLCLNNLSQNLAKNTTYNRYNIHVAYSTEIFEVGDSKETHYKKGRDDFLCLYLASIINDNNPLLLSMDKYADHESFKNIAKFKHIYYEFKADEKKFKYEEKDINPQKIYKKETFKKIIYDNLYRYGDKNVNDHIGKIFKCETSDYRNESMVALAHEKHTTI